MDYPVQKLKTFTIAAIAAIVILAFPLPVSADMGPKAIGICRYLKHANQA